MGAGQCMCQKGEWQEARLAHPKAAQVWQHITRRCEATPNRLREHGIHIGKVRWQGPTCTLTHAP